MHFMHFGHLNIFHFPGVERLQTRPPSVCRSPPASPGEAKAPTHLAGFPGADPTRKKGRWGNAGDSLKQSINQ